MRPTMHHLAWRLDRLCARLNAGLAAAAIVLAAVLASAAAGRAMPRLEAPPLATIAPAAPAAAFAPITSGL